MSSEHRWRWWRRLFLRWPWRRRGLPTWGAGPPTILGVCLECGAVVLDGWHRQVPEGLLCQRCAGKKGG
ncbi:MAG: hypothetical protein Q8M54_07380 [Desulfobaccales bacterium]|nr:hypothetical protein [Desulfobaccales bacterium]